MFKPLLPCPFCGSLDLKTEHLGDATRDFWVVDCEACHSCGPVAHSEEEAEEAWNERIPLKGGN